MKLVITESQFNRLVACEGLYESFATGNLLNEGRLRDDIKTSIRNALVAGATCASILAALHASGNLTPYEKEAAGKYATAAANELNKNDKSTNEYAIYEKGLHDLKVKEMERCMQEKYLRLKGHKDYNAKDIVLSAEQLVTDCEETNYDIVLAAAQAWNESAWGTTPRARRSNSVFSVGAYDNGEDVVSYSHQNASVRPYINLMQNDYSMNGDTLTDIMSGKRQLVNQQGKRYASDVNYEKKLRATYNAIKKTYPILSWDLETYIDYCNSQTKKS